jgi:hypothetical protein
MALKFSRVLEGTIKLQQCPPQSRKRGLSRNQPLWYLGSGFSASRTVRK